MVNPDRVKKLAEAIQTGDMKMVGLMIKAGVPANHYITSIGFNDRQGLAHLAAEHAQAEIFHLLIELGADIDALQEYSWREPKSMLQCACSGEQPSVEIVQTILKQGHPSPEQVGHALISAAYSSEAVVSVLLDFGADPNFINESFTNALIVAVIAKQEAIAIRLLQAGADPTQRIRNHNLEEFWKKTILEAAEAQGMKQFLAAAQQSGAVAATPAKTVAVPATIRECWQVIDHWLAEHAAGLQLPAAAENVNLERFGAPVDPVAWASIEELLNCHNGTGNFSLFVLPGDAPYCMLPMHDSLEARRMMREISDGERQESTTDWWSDSWWPLGDNGGGDLLVVDCERGPDAGQVFHFSHETCVRTLYKRSVLELFQGIVFDLLTESLTYCADEMGLV